MGINKRLSTFFASIMLLFFLTAPAHSLEGYIRGNLIVNGKTIFTGQNQKVEKPVGTVTATLTGIQFAAHKDITITGLEIVSVVDITPDDTNYWSFDWVNRGDDGAGSTSLIVGGDAATTKATGGSAIDIYEVRSFALTATTADLNIDEGEVISFTITKAASAADLTEISVIVKYTER